MKNREKKIEEAPSLGELGWKPFRSGQMQLYSAPGLFPVRVARQDKGSYTVVGEAGRLSAELAGKLRHQVTSSAQLPVVGDWVVIRHGGKQERAVIHAVLERRGSLSRKQAGTRTEEQVLCANVDVVFIVSSLHGSRGFVLSRIERFLTLALDSRIQPIIVLNKSDLCDEVELRISQAREIACGTPVYGVSALTGAGMDEAFSYLSPGTTSVLLGPSGVGKSSLINSLLGKQVLNTGPVRSADGRGRHITTWRELVVVSGRGIIIDTPGLRELQPWGDSSAVQESFREIDLLARSCRFRNCTHHSEPGCAVTQAVRKGILDEARLTSYLKQQEELVYLENRRNEHAKQMEKAKWKSIHRSLKTFNKINPKRKWEKLQD